MGKLTVFTDQDIDGVSEKITYDSDKGIAKIGASGGYYSDIKTLAKLKDTGNGYVIKFKEQDNYICIGYEQADYLKKLLNIVIKDI